MDTLTDTPTGDVVVNLDTSAISFPTLPNGTNYNTQNALRLFYGYDHGQKSYLGLSVDEERQRTSALAVLINTDHYDEARWTKGFRLGVNLNNAIYKYVYQIFFLTLAFTAGVIFSVVMGIVTSTFEFVIAFFARPLLRLFRMFADLWIIVSHIVADTFRPVAALLLPWNKN